MKFNLSPVIKYLEECLPPPLLQSSLDARGPGNSFPSFGQDYLSLARQSSDSDWALRENFPLRDRHRDSASLTVSIILIFIRGPLNFDDTASGFICYLMFCEDLCLEGINLVERYKAMWAGGWVKTYWQLGQADKLVFRMSKYDNNALIRITD